MIVALIFFLVGLGTVVFHFWSPWWWTPIASNWGYVDDTILVTFWITGVVFVAVVMFTVYCIVRYRYKPDRRAEYEPENSKLEIWLTGLTTLGVAGMLAPGLFVWAQYVNVPEEASEFEALGSQWTWVYRFPGEDGQLGVTDIRLISDDNTFGIDPEDPNGQDDVLIEDSEVHLPIDKPVKVLLRSVDVLHDFYVPQFRAKMDIVPGMITYFWLTPTRTGTFDVMCFELCGTGHYAMRGLAVVEEEADFQAWLEEHPTFAETQAEARAPSGNDLAGNDLAGDDPRGEDLSKLTDLSLTDGADAEAPVVTAR